MTVPLNANESYCRDCGAAISARAEICPKCGVRQRPVPVNLAGRNRVAAALFAIFLGAFGIHKFYLGRVGWGIIYLLLCWTMLPLVVGFIEGIVYLTMTDEAFNAKYNP